MKFNIPPRRPLKAYFCKLIGVDYPANQPEQAIFFCHDMPRVEFLGPTEVARLVLHHAEVLEDKHLPLDERIYRVLEHNLAATASRQFSPAARKIYDEQIKKGTLPPWPEPTPFAVSLAQEAIMHAARQGGDSSPSTGPQ